MTEKEILEKAIQKAIEAGWKPESFDNGLTWYPDGTHKWGQHMFDAGLGEWGGEADLYDRRYELIFNHDFAKALFGTSSKHNISDTGSNGVMNGHFLHLDRWQWKLMQMVIADDPIKYLGDNLPV